MSLIHQLATAVGFYSTYTDAFGHLRTAKEEAFQALLGSMGFDINDDNAIKESINTLQQKSWRNILPSVHIAKLEQKQHTVIISVDSSINDDIHWKITTENGQQLAGKQALSSLTVVETATFAGTTFNKVSLALPTLALGYHELTVTLEEHSEKCPLIYAPKSCYLPTDAANFKIWGYAAQLYSLKSKTNWGIGDFTDLQSLIKQSAAQGASVLGLNPLHPLYQNNPEHCSPYSPMSRSFLNPLYIDVCQIENFKTAKKITLLLADEHFQHALQQVQHSELIDYKAAATLKYQVLEALYQDFLLNANSELNAEFEQYQNSKGQDLIVQATFEALFEYFREQDENSYGWQDWPIAYQQPSSKEVKSFQQTHEQRIGYFAYLQWQAHRQLSKVKTLAQQSDMPVGLYLDLAVGCHGSGVDVWANNDVYVPGAAIGAPPDAMNTLGQNWGLTPINPVALQQQGYMPLVKALRASMQYAGALRIDHILGLLRQYWVAPGMKANEGVYITYPLDDILRIIALESQRTKCVVIGEDLGTVPEGFSETTQAAGLLSYKVLYFEKWSSGLFKRPSEYPELSMVTVSTHDLPTLTGWWCGQDLQWRQNLNLYPNEEMGEADRNGRIIDRSKLLLALDDMGVINKANMPTQSPPVMNRELTLAVQKFLALAPSRIQLIPMEDALEIRQQVNVPGTVDEHPNWRRKLHINIEEFSQQASVRDLAEAMQQARPKLRGK